MPRHGPNRFDKYTKIHESYMRSHTESGFVTDDSCEFQVADGIIILSGTVRCLGGIELRVFKSILVLSGDGPTAMVQRAKYNYHAQFRDGTPILRYDSADDHRPLHHKHIYDPFDPSVEGELENIPDVDDTPTMGQVIEELEVWYWANKATISALGHE